MQQVDDTRNWLLLVAGIIIVVICAAVAGGDPAYTPDRHSPATVVRSERDR